ncbi:hypothetical protein HK102_002695, partial [Quaeritorhiza haematococci]
TLVICAKYVHDHREEIKSLKEYITSTTYWIAEFKTRLADLEGERRDLKEQMDPVMAEGLEQKPATLEKKISTFRRLMMTREVNVRKANAEIEGRQKILEAVNSFREQVWEMLCEDPKTPLPPVPDFDSLYQTHLTQILPHTGPELDTEVPLDREKNATHNTHSPAISRGLEYYLDMCLLHPDIFAHKTFIANHSPVPISNTLNNNPTP